MHKLWVALVAMVFVLAGCNVQKIPNQAEGNAPAITPSATPGATNFLPRLDVSGNIITTVYAEGVFIKAEDGTLFMTENGKERKFILSARAEKDITALKITEGTKIIVNYNRVDEGQEAEALSLEKLL